MSAGSEPSLKELSNGGKRSWGMQDRVGGVNAEEGGDASEDTEEEGLGNTIDTEERPRGEEGARGDAI